MAMTSATSQWSNASAKTFGSLLQMLLRKDRNKYINQTKLMNTTRRSFPLLDCLLLVIVWVQIMVNYRLFMKITDPEPGPI